MTSGLSLAHKCQILFGLAIVLLITAALSVPWFRVASLVEETQRENCEQVAELWLTWALGELPGGLETPEAVLGELSRKLTQEAEESDLRSPAEAGVEAPSVPGSPGRVPRLRILSLASFADSPNVDPLANAARRQFEQDAEVDFLSSTQRDDAGEPVFRYARALRARDLSPSAASGEATSPAEALVGILLVEQSAGRVAGLLLVDRMYIIATGLTAGALASLVFYWITTRLILSPVRVLRDVTERVQEGELLVRSDLRTRDEFEQLSDTFNGMLIAFKEQQDNLRAANISLDNRLTELAQMNVDL
ncbi:MAG: HAMP domain-containing protein, partial [Phycisphaerales bacterium JB038]